MNDFTPHWFVNEKTNEIMYQDSCGDFMIPTKEQLAEILNNNEKRIAGYLLMLKQQEKTIEKLQKRLDEKENPEPQSEGAKILCDILKFPSQTREEQ